MRVLVLLLSLCLAGAARCAVAVAAGARSRRPSTNDQGRSSSARSPSRATTRRSGATCAAGEPNYTTTSARTGRESRRARSQSRRATPGGASATAR